MAFISYAIYLIFLPIRWLLYLVIVKGFHYIFQTLGFTIGLLGGLVAGYFIFIHKLPTAVEEPEVKELIPEGATLKEEELQEYYSYLPPWVSNPDYERVDWMNKLVAEMWPYLNKAISEQIREIGTPILKAQQPAFIETLEFQEIDLGTIPPAVLGHHQVILHTALHCAYEPQVRASAHPSLAPLLSLPPPSIKSFDTTDDEVILQTALRWAANNNIIVAASAKGFTGTVQITDLQVAAVTRITLKPLMPIFPCFSTITVSFMDKPQVDFGLKVVGLDVMAIPGLYTYVQVSVELAGCFTFEGPQSLKVVGLAVMAIPGLYTYVQKTIGNIAASIYMCLPSFPLVSLLNFPTPPSLPLASTPSFTQAEDHRQHSSKHVHKTIGNVAASMYMWPKVLEVYDDQPLAPIGWLVITHIKGTHLRNLGGMMAKSDPYGTHLRNLGGMMANAPIGWLVITHIKGTHLRNLGGMMAKSDPYVRFSIDGRALGRRSTSVKKDDLDPDWGKEELLVRVADLQKQKLHIEVFDKSFTSTQQLPLVDPDWAKEELLVRVADLQKQKLHVEVFDKSFTVGAPTHSASSLAQPTTTPTLPPSPPPPAPAHQNKAARQADEPFMRGLPCTYRLAHHSPPLVPPPSPNHQNKPDKLMSVTRVALEGIHEAAPTHFESRLVARFADLEPGAQTGSKKDLGFLGFDIKLRPLAKGEAEMWRTRSSPRGSREREMPVDVEIEGEAEMPDDVEIKVFPSWLKVGGGRALLPLTKGEAEMPDDVEIEVFPSWLKVGGGRVLLPLAKGEAEMPDDVEIEVFPSWLKVGGGRLRMMLREGENLESNKHANPFVQLRFRAHEWTSKVHKKAAELTFDEDDKWELLLDEPPAKDVLHVKVYSKNMSTLSISSSKDVLHVKVYSKNMSTLSISSSKVYSKDMSTLSISSSKDLIGHCDINLSDVVANGRINDFYLLSDSPKNGRIKIELQWHERTPESTVVNEPPPATRVQ
ncbi:unnamed protein product [Closterium sp. NIES-64]|nr:unnamed protein product [Closterium sp. NIES-64]